MLSIEEILAEVVDVQYDFSGVVKIGYITFSDGSVLEIASDRVYTYPLTRTDGIAKSVGSYELQLVDFRTFRHYLDNRQVR